MAFDASVVEFEEIVEFEKIVEVVVVVAVVVVVVVVEVFSHSLYNSVLFFILKPIR